MGRDEDRVERFKQRQELSTVNLRARFTLAPKDEKDDTFGQTSCHTKDHDNQNSQSEQIVIIEDGKTRTRKSLLMPQDNRVANRRSTIIPLAEEKQEGFVIENKYVRPMVQLLINSSTNLQELVTDPINALAIFDAMAHAYSLWGRAELAYSRDMKVLDDEIT